MNRNMLKGKIAEKGLNQSQLADIIGISNNSMSRKLLGKREFTISEAMKICKALDIQDPAAIFFSH